MNTNNLKNFFLVIYGPNMNLISLRPIAKKNKLTLDKINKCLKTEAQSADRKLKVIQTNDEIVATRAIQRLRNKISGIIIFPGAWQSSAHIIKDTLEIVKIPFVTVSTGENAHLLKGIKNITNTNLLKGCQEAIQQLIKSS
jgi:3-dehydroquinate dehydratase